MLSRISRGTWCGFVDILAAAESQTFEDLAKEAITVSDAAFTLAVISLRQLIYVKRCMLARGARTGEKAAQDLKNIERLIRLQ